jgi:predicted MFS family arabinose efflux permease
MTVLKPLRNPAFRRLAATYTLDDVAWSFGTVALAILVYDRTGSALASTALFLASTFVPALLAPALTARLDRLPVRRALPALYLVEAALYLVLVLAAGRFWLPLVLLLAIGDGAIAIVGRALTRAAVASVLKPSGELEAGNKLLNVALFVAHATGPALGGAVVAVAGVRASLTATALVFALMALTLATARTLPQAHGDSDRSWWQRLRDGLVYVRAHGPVRRILIAHGAALCFGAAATPIEVVYADDALHAGASGYGLLLAAWGVGAVLSSIALARAEKTSAIVLIPVGAVGVGAGFVVMGLAPSLAVAMLGCLVGGAGNGVYYVSVVQALQERIAEDLQARVMSLLESTTAGAYGIGFLVGGALTAIWSSRLAIGVAGVGVILAAGAIVALVRGERRPASPARIAVPSAPVETVATS